MNYIRLTEILNYYSHKTRDTLQELFHHVTCKFPSYSGLEAAAITREGRIINIPYGGPIGDLRARIVEMWDRVLYAKGKSEHPANRGRKRPDIKPVKLVRKYVGNGVPAIKNPEGRWLRTRGS